MSRRRVVSDVREKIRIGYEQVGRGETVNAHEAWREIKAISKKARKIAKKPK